MPVVDPEPETWRLDVEANYVPFVSCWGGHPVFHYCWGILRAHAFATADWDLLWRRAAEEGNERGLSRAQDGGRASACVSK